MLMMSRMKGLASLNPGVRIPNIMGGVLRQDFNFTGRMGLVDGTILVAYGVHSPHRGNIDGACQCLPLSPLSLLQPSVEASHKNPFVADTSPSQ